MIQQDCLQIQRSVAIAFDPSFFCPQCSNSSESSDQSDSPNGDSPNSDSSNGDSSNGDIANTRGVMTTRFSDPKHLFATYLIILVPNGDFPSRPFTKPVESCRR